MTSRNGQNARQSRKPPLLLVGWDGAQPDLLERFVKAEKLPTVARLIEAGSFRRLRSTIPPVTACAWCSFLSGKNPGKHGLFDFVTPRKDSYKFDYTNGGYRRDRNADIVALCNRRGLRVGCVNVPMTYPPTPIDGFMISGLDAPDEKSGIAEPADLFERAQQKVGPYQIDNRHLGSMRTEADRRQALDEFKRIESRRTDVTLAMIEESPVDVLIIIYNATDQVQHHFWHLMDAGHPAHPGPDSPEVRAFANAIEEIYVHCDSELEKLVRASPDSDLMLMSDHGAGPTSGPCVRINTALSHAGLLNWAKSKGNIVTDTVAQFDGFLRRNLSAKQKAFLARLLPAGRTAIESMGLPPIDWKNTQAFAYEGFTLSPCVWINRKSLFAEGTVEAGAEYERVRERVVEALTTLRDPEHNEPVIPRIYAADEVYHGDYIATAPDLILDWWEGRTFTIEKSHPRHDKESPVFFPPRVAEPGRDITGIHRRDGIFVASGPRLVRCAQTPPPADLIDIAPTSMALLEIPIPADVDGHVLRDVVGERVATQAEAYVDAATASAADAEAPVYSEKQREMIEKRLSDLGYL